MRRFEYNHQLGSATASGERPMIDYLARAKRRAKKCKLSSENGKSQKFADCHRLLAQNYALLATVEEEFLARAIARGKNKVP